MRGDARILQGRVDAGGFMDFNFLAIVKETGVDDKGLNEFLTEYFPYSAFKDQNLTFYNALGSGKAKIGYNPVNMLKFMADSMKRWKELGVKSYNTKGEGFLQGGWILLDRNGVPQAAFQENMKQRVPIDEISEAMFMMRRKSESN